MYFFIAFFIADTLAVSFDGYALPLRHGVRERAGQCIVCENFRTFTGIRNKGIPSPSRELNLLQNEMLIFFRVIPNRSCKFSSQLDIF